MAATTWRLAVQRFTDGFRSRTWAPRCRGCRSRWTTESAAARAAWARASSGSCLRLTWCPADAEVDDAGMEAEPVEHLDRVVAHLLEPHRTGTALAAAQPQQS